jgi:hypothetical protein
MIQENIRLQLIHMKNIKARRVNMELYYQLQVAQFAKYCRYNPCIQQQNRVSKAASHG